MSKDYDWLEELDDFLTARFYFLNALGAYLWGIQFENVCDFLNERLPEAKMVLDDQKQALSEEIDRIGGIFETVGRRSLITPYEIVTPFSQIAFPVECPEVAEKCEEILKIKEQAEFQFFVSYHPPVLVPLLDLDQKTRFSRVFYINAHTTLKKPLKSHIYFNIHYWKRVDPAEMLLHEILHTHNPSISHFYIDDLAYKAIEKNPDARNFINEKLKDFIGKGFQKFLSIDKSVFKHKDIILAFNQEFVKIMGLKHLFQPTAHEAKNIPPINRQLEKE
ncbi:MAG: hypothetical protein Q6356_012115 [Candidatus Wukongarchaeota archaeon]|nr:hypothetical protein [Candidatus Wukongarchaeota archaeon]